MGGGGGFVGVTWVSGEMEGESVIAMGDYGKLKTLQILIGGIR